MVGFQWNINVKVTFTNSRAIFGRRLSLQKWSNICRNVSAEKFCQLIEKVWHLEYTSFWLWQGCILSLVRLSNPQQSPYFSSPDLVLLLRFFQPFDNSLYSCSSVIASAAHEKANRMTKIMIRMIMYYQMSRSSTEILP